MSLRAASSREILIAAIADLLTGVRTVAVGASSPIPAAGAMLLRARNETRGRMRIRIAVLGSREHNFFTNGAFELFDCAAQGRIDAFFLGGGQIDGQANINLVGIGDYPRTEVRWPGSFGSAFLYYAVPRVILFREEHSRRVFVDKVDFVSAPGTSEGIVRDRRSLCAADGTGAVRLRQRAQTLPVAQRASRRDQRRGEGEHGFRLRCADFPADHRRARCGNARAAARTGEARTRGDLSAIRRVARRGD